MNRRMRKYINVIVAVVVILTAGGGIGSALGILKVGPVPSYEEPLAAADIQATLEPEDTPRPAPQPPPGAEPIRSLDLGLQQNRNGALAGTLSGRVACDADNLMRIETSQRTLVAGVPVTPQWNCDKAVEQWRTIAAADSPFGVRYNQEPGQAATVTLVGEDGRSVSMLSSGAWALP